MTLTVWMREVRRLCAALKARGADLNEGVGVVHAQCSADPKKPPWPAWKAYCGHRAVYESSPDDAMRGLIEALRNDLAERIESRREELEKLETAHKQTLKIVQPPKEGA